LPPLFPYTTLFRSLSGPLVDVPDAVRGDFREPGGGRGGRERPKRPPGDDLRPRRQGGPNLGLVPPRRIRPADARRVARPRRSDSCALACQAEGDRLIPRSQGRPNRPARPLGRRRSTGYDIKLDREEETTIASDHGSGLPPWRNRK